MFDSLIIGIDNLVSLNSILLLMAGSAVGLLFGAIPGLGGTTAVALMIPLTFGMEPFQAIILMGGIMAATSTGGSVSAILLNTPGIAPNAATTFDGYPLAKQGKAGMAIGAGATASALGGVVGIISLVAVIPIMKEIVLLFTPPEFFMLAIFGLCAIAVSSGDRLLQGLITAIIGLVVGFVGLYDITGTVRYSMGIPLLEDGIKLVPALIGLFAISEMINLAVKGGSIAEDTSSIAISRVSDGIKQVFKNWSTMLVGSGYGTFIGAIPGVGGTVAAFLSYSTQVQRDPDPDIEYGKGNIKGVIAPESANNAKDGGSLIPTLAFGIPGSAETAVFLGVLILHGIEPGQKLLVENEPLVFTLVVALTVSVVFATLVVLALAKYMAMLTMVSVNVLIPTVSVIALVGAYALHTEIGDVVIALIFAIIGYFMIRFNYPRVTFTIALVLGTLTELNFDQTMQIHDGDMTVFLTRWLSVTLLILTVLSLGFPTFRKKVRERNRRREAEASK